MQNEIPADLLREQVKRSGGSVRLRSSLWQKLQIGRRLTVAVIVVLLAGLVHLAMMKQGGAMAIFLASHPPEAAPVIQIRLTMVAPPGQGGDPRPWTHPAETEAIDRLWGWWQEAEMIGTYAAPERLRGRPVIMIFELRDGQEVRITQAFDCMDDLCTVSEHDVILLGAADPLRYRAPLLAAWLAGGGQQEPRRAFM